MHARNWVAVAAAVAAVGAGTMFGGSVSAAAVGQPAFTCNNDTFFSYTSGGTTHFSRIAGAGGTATITDFGTVTDNLNAMGYNPVDNFLYELGTPGGPNSGNLVRIGSNGATSYLGVPTGIDTNLGFNAGTFIAPNKFLVGAGILDGGVAKTSLSVIDIATKTVVATATATGSFADYATNPLDGKVYGFNQIVRQLGTIDPTTGDTNLFGQVVGTDMTVGSDWFLNSGQMLLYGTPFDGGDQTTFYDADAGTNASGTGTLTAFATGPTASGTDGASCVALPDESTTTSTTTSTSTRVVDSATSIAPTGTEATAAVPVHGNAHFTG